MTSFLQSQRPILHASHPKISQLTALFFQLPPSYRAFHASPQPQFLDAAITASHTLLETLHSTTGLSWALTIPLTALTVRTFLVLPIGIYSRRAHQQQAALAPLTSAWQHNIRKDVMNEMGHMGPAIVQQRVQKKTQKKQKELYARWGCGRWRNFLPFMQLPIWLVVIETIREMCGAQLGLLGMAAKGFSSMDTTNVAVKSGMVDSMVGTVVGKESAFSTEGMLWFQDLMAADSHLILPFVLSGAVFLNLSNIGIKSQFGKQSVGQRRLLNSLRIVALAIGPLTLQVPSAMLVYWISSSTLAYMQAVLLERVMPIKPPAMPFKSPPPRLLPPS